MRSAPSSLLLWPINLLMPGGGLILAGGVAWGLTLGVAFSVLAGLLITAVYIVPAEYSAGQKWMLAGCLAALWLATQILLAGRLRSAHNTDAASTRRDTLVRAQKDLARGEPRSAIRRLESLSSANPRDLHIAVRLAEALTVAADPRAEAAWRRVHALDRHHIYSNHATPASTRKPTPTGGPADPPH